MLLRDRVADTANLMRCQHLLYNVIRRSPRVRLMIFALNYAACFEEVDDVMMPIAFEVSEF